MNPSGARWCRCAAAALLGLAAVVVLAAASAQAASGQLTRALTDDIWFDGGPSWLARTEATGVKVVLLEIDWAGVEGNPPPAGVDPTNPADPQFDFSYVDAVVRQFVSTGIQPAFLVTDAPRWAEAPGGPAILEQDGAWEPNATAFGQLATALARRYSGSYPDPLHPGHVLPRVRYFQAWAEANFSVHLAPQWVRNGGRWVPASPSIYRNLLNAFYAGIKKGDPGDFVIATGLGPYGDPSPGPCTGPNAPDVGNGCRIEPALFAREMMCLNGRVALRPVSCPDPPHFDAIAFDPYEVGGPTTSAGNTPGVQDDVSAPDLGRLTRIVSKAVRVGHALPRARKQLWVTEFGYQSNPPDPNGVSLATQARWLEQALYLFWKQGVSTAVWYLLRDEQYSPDALGYTGLYLYNGAPKPSLRAYQFPLVVAPSGRHAALVWGISPRSGTLLVQRQKGRGWKTLLRVQVHVSGGGVFVRRLSASPHGRYRAVVGGEASLVWAY
jgi:hypothetical protein